MASRVWNMSWCCSKINLANSKIIIISVYSNSTHNYVNISWKSNNIWNTKDESRKCCINVNSTNLYQVSFACTFPLWFTYFLCIYDTLKKINGLDSGHHVELSFQLLVNLVRFCNNFALKYISIDFKVCFDIGFFSFEYLYIENKPLHD